MSMAAAIVGAGESQFGRSVDRPIAKLVLDACRNALADAGVTASDIDGVIAAGAYPGPDEVSVALGIDRMYTAAPGIPAGAGPLAAVETARAAVESGRATTVLVYYGYAGSKPGGPYGFHAQDPVKASVEMPFAGTANPCISRRGRSATATPTGSTPIPSARSRSRTGSGRR